MAHYSIKWGFIQKTAKEIQGAFDLKRFTKWILDQLHVNYYDSCCDSAKTLLPVGLNTSGNALQYFNGTTWVAVPAGDVTLPAAATFSTSVTTPHVITDLIGAYTGSFVGFANNTVTRRFTAAYNTTASVSAADVIKGVLTSTSAATVTLTLPTATALAAVIGAARGTTLQFSVDNSVGANTITVTPDASTTASSVITGGTTMTVASGTVGTFGLYFQSATAAKLYRIA